MNYLLSIFLFESPTSLWGLLLISVPIIVHLFNLRKAKKLEFSNIELLRKVSEETNAKKRPIELIILLFRILAVSALVIAFAKPLIKTGQQETSLAQHTTIYLDNSKSMSAQQVDGSALDKAYALASGLLSSYPEETSFSLIENSYSSTASTVLSKTAMENALVTIDQVGVDRSAKELLSRISSSENANEVYWFSDFNALTDLNLLLKDSARTHYLVPILANEDVNIYVDSVYLENTFYSGEFVNNIVIELASTQKVTRLVNLRVNQGDQLLGTTQVSFDNSDKAFYNYNIPSEIRDLSQLSIDLEGVDALYDNMFFMSINELDQTSVLEVFDDESNTFIPALYRENDLFSFKRIDLNALQSGLFEEADFVILNELSSFSNQLVGYLETFLSEGGTLLVIPNAKMPEASFGRIGVDVVKDDQLRLALNPIDFANPFFDGIFLEEEFNIKMPEATTQWRPISSEYELLRYRNERPFLSKIASGNQIYFLSSSLLSAYSNFGSNAIFVPIMYKLALGAQSNANKLYYYTDSEFMAYPLSDGFNDVYRLVSESAEIVPDQRIGTGELLMEIPKDQIDVGQYYLVNERDTLGVISLNLPKSESRYNTKLLAQLEQLSAFDHIQVLNLESKDQVIRFVNDNLRGKSLWKYFLFAALFFLFAEIILIRYL